MYARQTFELHKNQRIKTETTSLLEGVEFKGRSSPLSLQESPEFRGSSSSEVIEPPELLDVVRINRKLV